MSDPVSALGGATSIGFATIRDVGPLGMITLRAKADARGLKAAIKDCVGTEIPMQGQILHHGNCSAAWMSPDEYLLILPYAATDAALGNIAKAMDSAHHLAVIVSDARVTFRIDGEKADQVVAKLSPVDLPNLPEGTLRRTRVAQVSAAFWRQDRGITLICFRSVARYVFDLLALSAKKGSELGQ
ncbi:MAG: sarcosine oxidase subunit gamma [Paracoccaceae bacterium]